MDICTNVTGLNNAKMTIVHFCLQSTYPNKCRLYDPLDNLRVSLPMYFTYHVDSFHGKSVSMISINANVPFCNVDWNTMEGVLCFETECDTERWTAIKIKPVALDL